VTASEILFIIFAVAFTLEEYTASREHGWDSESRHTCHIMAPELTMSFVIVYLANVCRCPENNGSPLTLDV
jgi:hypothetical protein